MNFHVDPWEAARSHYEREMHMFMARLMHHFKVQQLEIPDYEMMADRGETVVQYIPERRATLYRLKGYFDIPPRP